MTRNEKLIDRLHNESLDDALEAEVRQVLSEAWNERREVAQRSGQGAVTLTRKEFLFWAKALEGLRGRYCANIDECPGILDWLLDEAEADTQTPTFDDLGNVWAHYNEGIAEALGHKFSFRPTLRQRKRIARLTFWSEHPSSRLQQVVLEEDWLSWEKHVPYQLLKQQATRAALIEEAVKSVDPETWKGLEHGWEGSLHELVEACRLVNR